MPDASKTIDAIAIFGARIVIPPKRQLRAENSMRTGCMDLTPDQGGTTNHRQQQQNAEDQPDHKGAV